MTNHFSTQTLKYVERKDDIAAIAEVLDLLKDNRLEEAKRALVILHAALQQAQTPRLALYDQREPGL